MLTSLTEIIPAILTDSPAKFKELVNKLEPLTDRIHLDITDGDFVPNKTIKGYEEIKEANSAVKFDIHLMVKKPQDQMQAWFYTNADRFIIHAESEVSLDEIIKDIKEHNRKVGLALNPETTIDKIESHLKKEVDFIQFMTIHPGFQGQKFLDEVVDKISSFHKKYPDIIIMCDGGVTLETAPKLARAGTSVLVSGSYIVKSVDMGEAIEQLKSVTSD